MRARDLSAVLVTGSVQELNLGSIQATVTVPENASWFRHASRQRYIDIELSWPSRTIILALPDAQMNSPSGYMVGANSPSFPTFAGAFAAFFHDQWVQTGANQPNLAQIVARIVDSRARIQRVVVRAASLDVWVDGRGIQGCRLELNSSTDRLETIVERGGRISFPLPRGLGEDPWLWLKSEGGWLDYRSVVGWGGRRSPDVEVERPEDPIADISALASQGESTYLEYKVALPGDDHDSKRKTLKTVVAFANGEGGTMLFGVEGDEDVGRIAGLVGRPADLRRRLNDLVRDRITPNPTWHLEGYDVEGKYVIRLNVAPGHGVLHALLMDTNKPEYYVRRNGSTYYARPEELAVIVQRGAQDPVDRLARFK
jgi:hypothetical protein